MFTTPLLTRVEKYVKALLTVKALHGRPFHNFNHTFHVVQKCDELATYYRLEKGDREALLTAAWFHDTGYLHGNINHEEYSAKFSSAFLKDLNAPPVFIARVNELILTTKLPAKPTTLLQEILCDADLHHLASKDHLGWSTRLCQEIEIQHGSPIDEMSWIKEDIIFYKTHHYFTEYAITFWESQKHRNLQTLIDLSSRQKE